MRKFVSPLLPLPPALAALACLTAAPACGQSYTFTSNGTGIYFTDTLTTGRPHAVDFLSKTSGQSAGKDAILTIAGFGNAGIVYTNVGQFYHQNTDLTTATVQLQDAASGAMLFAGGGPMHYEFITSPYGIDTLTLGGTTQDAVGTPWNFNFFKDEDKGVVISKLMVPVPEPAPAVDLGLMLGLTLASVVWNARKRRNTVQDDQSNM